MKGKQERGSEIATQCLLGRHLNHLCTIICNCFCWLMSGTVLLNVQDALALLARTFRG